MLDRIYNPSVAYPFNAQGLTQEQLNTARAFKDCRLCLRLQGMNPAEPLKVTLQTASGTSAIFRVQGGGYTQPWFISFSETGLVSSSPFFNPENSYMLLADSSIPSYTEGSLTLLQETLVLYSSGSSLVLHSSPVHQQAIIEPSTVNIPVTQKFILNSGYNCSVSLQDDGSLSIGSFQGAGLGQAQGYKHWVQFSQGQYAQMTDDQIDSQFQGVLAINGQTGSIQIATTASITSTIETQGSQAQGIKLTVNLSKTQAEIS